jgi:hypothetical protein
MARVRIFIEGKIDGQALHLLASPYVQISDDDILNETKVAEAAHKLADNMEKGCLFQPVRAIENVPFAGSW